jgi:hypothetical protein
MGLNIGETGFPEMRLLQKGRGNFVCLLHQLWTYVHNCQGESSPSLILFNALIRSHIDKLALPAGYIGDDVPSEIIVGAGDRQNDIAPQTAKPAL